MTGGGELAELQDAWAVATAAHDAQHARREGRRAAWLARMPGALAVPGEQVLEKDFAATLEALPNARVVWLQPDHLGDVLLRGPAMQALRRRLPAARVTLVVGPWSRVVAEHLPGVDEVASMRFPAFVRPSRPDDSAGIAPWLARLLGAYMQLARASLWLRRRRFDVAFIGRDDDWWSAWATALARVPLRIGHSGPTLAPFLTRALKAAARPDHVADASLALVGTSAVDRADARDHGLPWRPSAADEARAAALMMAAADNAPIAIHPGSGSAIKRWPAASWVAVVRALCEPGAAIVLTGGPGEESLTAAVAARLHAAGRRPILDLSGRTDIGTLAAVYGRCRLVMGPDSGPLHLATAVDTPTVHLFGPADAARFGPWGPPARHQVVTADFRCAPCGRLDWPAPSEHPCVQMISPHAVIEAARLAMAAES